MKPKLPIVKLTASAMQAQTTDATAPNSRAIVENKITKWELGDQVALYALSYNDTPGTAAAVISAIEISDDGKMAYLYGDAPEPATSKDTFYAVYPSDCPINSTRAQFTIAATQAATTSPKLPMVATCTETDIHNIQFAFKAATAFLRVPIAAGLGIKSVRFEGCNGENVAGTYEYSFADNSTVVTGTDKSITIENPGTEVYFTLPAITLSKGYKLTFVKGAEQMIKSYGYGVSKQLAAGDLYSVPEVTAFTPISVTLGTVTTSYSLYLAGDIEAANAFSSTTVQVNDCSFTGIPNGFISEAGIMIDGNNNTATVSSSAKTFSGLTATVTTRGTVSVKAYIKDLEGNIYETASQEAVITGLPYTANPPRNSGDYAWSASGGNASWDSDGFLLRGLTSAPRLVSADFYIPANTDVNVAVSGVKQGTVVAMSFYVVVNGSNIVTTSLSGGNSPYSLNGNGTFTPSAKSVTVRSDYTTAGPTTKVSTVTVNYR